jgi:hypothetical protein
MKPMNAPYIVEMTGLLLMGQTPELQPMNR